MTIYEAEETIFKQWEGSRKGFVRDGVISEIEYLASNPKITFILKEVNDPDGGGWDLRKFVFEGGRPQTWNNIARWVHGIKNLKSIPEWSFYSDISNDFRIEALKSICVLNLKKSPGTHTTDYLSLNAAANEDKEFIRRQYSIYNPELTICCGTGELFKDLMGYDSKKWKSINTWCPLRTLKHEFKIPC